MSFAFKPWGQDGQESQELLIWENMVHDSSLPLLPVGESHTVWVFTLHRGRQKGAVVTLGCEYRQI